MRHSWANVRYRASLCTGKLCTDIGTGSVQCALEVYTCTGMAVHWEGW